MSKGSCSRRTRAIIVAIACFLLQPLMDAPARAFPKNQPIRIVVPAPPGGALDVVARLMALQMSKNMNHSVIVENRPGGRSTIATNAVSKSEPDGHTLLAISTSLAMGQALYNGRNYDLNREFTPVSLIASGPLLMVVNKSLPVESIADIVKLAKSKPGDLKYGSGGVGTSMHLTAFLFTQRFGVDMQHIPFQGGGPALNAVLGGHIEILFDPVVTLLPQVTGGSVKALAITSPTRSPLLPNVPTVAESGAPGFDVAGWFAFVAPAGTPPDVISVLQKEVVKAVAAGEVKERLDGLGVQAVGSTSDELGAYLHSEVDKWTRIVTEANIKGE
jgi:tripartite-type tricarboxylate transporter receptor subunit TctC